MKAFEPNFLKLYPKRSKTAHKFEVGKVGILAGSEQLFGAAILTAYAALRSGAGVVYVYTAEKIAHHIVALHPELIVCPLPCENGIVSKSSLPLLSNFLQEHRLDALAIGPGLGKSDSLAELLINLVKKLNDYKIPTLIDADGLNNLDMVSTEFNAGQYVFTPHEGEFIRNFCVDLIDNRLEAASNISSKLKQVLVLKGYQTIVSNQSFWYQNKTGNSGMATAGSGDTLTGFMVGFMAQKLSLFDAALLAVYLHGLSGDEAFKEKGNGLIASDIIEYFSVPS